MLRDGERGAMRWTNLNEGRALYFGPGRSQACQFTHAEENGSFVLQSLGVSRAETQEALRQKRPAVTDTYVSVYMEQRREHIEQVAALLTNGQPSVPQSSPKGG